MIQIETKLDGDLEHALEQFSEKVRGEILISSAAAMARVVYDELLLNTSPPRMGRKTGALHGSVYRTLSDVRSDEDTKAYHVSVNKSKAPHWHFLEYGTSRMAARPYLRPAYESKVDEAIKDGREQMRQKMKELG